MRDYKLHFSLRLQVERCFECWQPCSEKVQSPNLYVVSTQHCDVGASTKPCSKISSQTPNLGLRNVRCSLKHGFDYELQESLFQLVNLA